tara:strand:- start:154 stop:582 length:429 start_codon:yes stop_codon:yes gene_type:complete
VGTGKKDEEARISGKINSGTSMEARIGLSRAVRDLPMAENDPNIPVVAIARMVDAPVMASRRTGNMADRLMASHRTGNRAGRLMASRRTGNAGVPKLPEAGRLVGMAGQGIESHRTGNRIAGPAGYIRKRVIDADQLVANKT